MGFVSRKEFLELAEILDSDRPFVEITGEEGVGKTASLEAIMEFLQQEGYIVFYGAPVSEGIGSTLKNSLEGTFLEPLVSKNPFDVKVMLFMNEDGMVLSSYKLADVDEDIIGSMTQVVGNFLTDTFSNMGGGLVSIKEENYNLFQYEGNSIAIYSVKGLGSLVVFFSGDVPKKLEGTLHKIVLDIRKKYGEQILNWNGTPLDEMREMFSPIDKLVDRGDINSTEKEFRFKRQFFEELGEKLEDTKIAFLIDDVNYADRTTKEILRTIPNLNLKNLAVVVSSESKNFDNYHNIRLSALNYDEAKELINSFFAIRKPSDELIEHLYKNTSGNPLLLVENIKKLKEEKFEFWNYKSFPDVISSMDDLAEYKLSNLNENELELVKYISLFGIKGIDREYLEISEDQEDELEKLIEKGILEVNKNSISFSFNELRNVVYSKLDGHFIDTVATKLIDKSNYKQAVKIYNEYINKTGDKKYFDKLFSSAASWFEGMRANKFSFEDISPVLEDLLNVMSTLDNLTSNVLRSGLELVINGGNLDSREIISEKIMAKAEEAGDLDLYFFAAYNYLRAKYKKRKFKEAYDFLKELDEKMKEVEDISEVIKDSVTITRLGMDKETGFKEKDYSKVKGVLEEAVKYFEKRKDNLSSKDNSKVQTATELMMINLSIYSGINLIEDKEERERAIKQIFGSKENYISSREELLSKIPKYANEIRHPHSKFSILRSYALYLIVSGEYEKAEEALTSINKELESAPNYNFGHKFLILPFETYFYWKSGRPEKTIELAEKWLPLMKMMGSAYAKVVETNLHDAYIAIGLRGMGEIISNGGDQTRSECYSDLGSIVLENEKMFQEALKVYSKKIV